MAKRCVCLQRAVAYFVFSVSVDFALEGGQGFCFALYKEGAVPARPTHGNRAKLETEFCLRQTPAQQRLPPAVDAALSAEHLAFLL